MYVESVECMKDWLLDEESGILQALCSWGHVTKFFAKTFLYRRLYMQFKECQKWKEYIENSKKAKFEAPDIKE